MAVYWHSQTATAWAYNFCDQASSRSILFKHLKHAASRCVCIRARRAHLIAQNLGPHWLACICGLVQCGLILFIVKPATKEHYLSPQSLQAQYLSQFEPAELI